MSPNSTINLNPVPYAFRYMAGHALLSPHLDWRHHGIGVLQAYLHEGDHEARIHVWHPSLVLAGFDETNGLVHDHRFDFSSYVLLGAVYNECFEFWGDSQGDWVKYGVTHARKAMQEKGDYHAPLGELDNGARYRAVRAGDWFQANSCYRMKARNFHMTRVQELTVTLVIKDGLVDGPAVIAGRHGVPLIHAFDHPKTDYLHLLDQAAKALLGNDAF
jgi:hypothetical protein